MDTQGCPHSSNAEISKGRLGRSAEKQENKSCLSPFPGRSILPPIASAFFHQAESTGKPTFSISSPKPRVKAHSERRKPTLGLLFRTNSCSNQRIFSLVEPTGLFIASECFISTLAALGGRGSSQTSGIKSSAENT